MLFYLGAYLQNFFGPARLLQSYTVLITLALYSGYALTYLVLPKFYDLLPHDRGREFTLTAEVAKGKPTGAGSVFITIFCTGCCKLYYHYIHIFRDAIYFNKSET